MSLSAVTADSAGIVSSNNNALKLRIGGVPEHFNLLWQLPSTREAFRNRGYYYEWTDFPGGTGAMSAALENGETDIALMLTEGAIAAIAQGKKFRIRLPFVVSPLIWGVFSSAARLKPELPAMNEAVFAVSRLFSGSHLMAQFLAQRYNVNLREEQFYISRDLEGARKALREGQADYFLWEQWMTRYLVHRGEFKQVDHISAPWPAFVFVTRGSELEHWEPVAEAIDDAIAMFEHLDQEALIEAIVSRYEIHDADAREWLETVRYYDGNSYWPDRMVAAAMIMQGKGMIDRVPALTEMT